MLEISVKIDNPYVVNVYVGSDFCWPQIYITGFTSCHLQLVPRPRKLGSIRPLPRTPS
jgi:hypothetical protein